MTKAEQNGFLVERQLDLVEELTAAEPAFEVRTVADLARVLRASDRIVERARAIAERELAELLEQHDAGPA